MDALTASNRKWLGPLATTGCVVVLVIATYLAASALVHGWTDPSSEPPPPRADQSAWVTVLFFGAGALLLFQGMVLRRRQRDSAHWPTTNGVVVEARTAILTRYTRVPAVVCDYLVAGRQYRTDQILLEPVDAKWFQPGKMLTLKYDPDDPAVVVAGTQMGTDKIWLSGLTFGIPFLLMLV